MKLKKSIIGAISLGILLPCVSCNSETEVINPSEREIKFKMAADNVTRGEMTTNNIEEFAVYALTDGKVLLDGARVVRTQGSVWECTPRAFWPETLVDFFSVYPSNTPLTRVGETYKIETWKVPQAADVDLLYAFNPRCWEETAGSGNSINPPGDPISGTILGVYVNFRHALSQVMFRFKNSNTEQIDVYIEEARIENIADTGTLNWATERTYPNYNQENHDKFGNDTEKGGAWGNWTDQSGAGHYSVANLPEGKLQGEASAASTPLFLMPQTLIPWTKEEGNTGARLLVKCRIMGGASKDIQLWPRGEANVGQSAWVAIPLDNPRNDPKGNNRWMQGKRYIYTVAFGDGAGFDPNDPSNPVLVPVKYTVQVDDYVNGSLDESDCEGTEWELYEGVYE